LDIDYEKKHWKENNWNREWKNKHFKIDFKNSQCLLKTESEEMHPLVALCYGFAIGYYYHPQKVSSGMRSRAEGEARNLSFSS